MYLRKQSFEDAYGESLFLWGARQTGKSTLLKLLYPALHNMQNDGKRLVRICYPRLSNSGFIIHIEQATDPKEVKQQ
ncbi:putative AAA+ superfamily ATPase [Roseimarinus sediminis]